MNLEETTKLELSETILNVDRIDELTFPQNRKIYKFDVNEFENRETCGSGRTVVYSCIFKPLKMKMAIKVINIEVRRNDKGEAAQNHLKKLKNELENLRSLEYHPNIVDFYGLCKHKDEAWFCMELMDCSLHAFYKTIHEFPCGKDNDGQAIFPEDLLGCISVSVVDALVHCKTKNVMHRDLKPHNILVKRTGDIKVCDFGLSKVMENSLTNSTVGTIAYWPPERLEKEEKPFYDNRADVWSLGITLVEIVMGILPYKNSQNKEITNIIQLQGVIKNINSEDLIKKFPKEYSEEARHFVKTCLIKNVQDRPDFDELQQHSFYTSRKSIREKRNETVKWYFDNYKEHLNINGSIKISDTSTSDSGFCDKSKTHEKLETKISNALAHISNTNLYDKEEINRRIQEVQKADSEHDYSLTNKFMDNILKLPSDNKISTNLISNRFRPTIFHGFYDFLNLEQAKNIALFHGLEAASIDLGKIDKIEQLWGLDATEDGDPGKLVKIFQEKKTVGLVVIFEKIDVLDKNSTIRVRKFFESILSEPKHVDTKKEYIDEYFGFPINIQDTIFMFTANSLKLVPKFIRKYANEISCGKWRDENFLYQSAPF